MTNDELKTMLESNPAGTERLLNTIFTPEERAAWSRKVLAKRVVELEAEVEQLKEENINLHKSIKVLEYKNSERNSEIVRLHKTCETPTGVYKA